MCDRPAPVRTTLERPQLSESVTGPPPLPRRLCDSATSRCALRPTGSCLRRSTMRIPSPGCETGPPARSPSAVALPSVVRTGGSRHASLLVLSRSEVLFPSTLHVAARRVSRAASRWSRQRSGPMTGVPPAPARPFHEACSDGPRGLLDGEPAPAFAGAVDRVDLGAPAVPTGRPRKRVSRTPSTVLLARHHDDLAPPTARSRAGAPERGRAGARARRATQRFPSCTRRAPATVRDATRAARRRRKAHADGVPGRTGSPAGARPKYVRGHAVRRMPPGAPQVAVQFPALSQRGSRAPSRADPAFSHAQADGPPPVRRGGERTGHRGTGRVSTKTPRAAYCTGLSERCGRQPGSSRAPALIPRW